MGSVWAASDVRTGVQVALKLIRDSSSLDIARVRLLREARATQRVTHAAIVPVTDVFFHEANPVLVMELLSGETLRVELHREQSLPLGRAAQLLLPIAEALHEAHGAGIVHRDIKPENIFVERPSDSLAVATARLLDFGVARNYEPQAGSEQTPITALGTLLGTLAYMAPEQAMRPSECDQRADIWAFGVCLYEVLSGCRPIEGNTGPETMRQLLVGGITPLAVLRPDLPGDIAALTQSMLVRRLDGRLATLGPVISILSKRLLG